MALRAAGMRGQGPQLAPRVRAGGGALPLWPDLLLPSLTNAQGLTRATVGGGRWEKKLNCPPVSHSRSRRKRGTHPACAAGAPAGSRGPPRWSAPRTAAAASPGSAGASCAAGRAGPGSPPASCSCPTDGGAPRTSPADSPRDGAGKEGAGSRTRPLDGPVEEHALNGGTGARSGPQGGGGQAWQRAGGSTRAAHPLQIRASSTVGPSLGTEPRPGQSKNRLVGGFGDKHVVWNGGPRGPSDLTRLPAGLCYRSL